MSGELHDDVNKVSNHNNILLQVKALQDIRGSIRKIRPKHRLQCDNNELKKDCQDDVDKNNEVWIWEADTKRAYFTNFMSELLGTGLLMLLGCMGCVYQVDTPPPSHHMSSLSFGLVILMIIQIFGHISGAHLNPTVTLSTVIFKMVSPTMAFFYIAGQFIGATFGFALLKILLPIDWVGPGFCAIQPHAKITLLQALIIEAIITCVLILVCCGVWDNRNANKQDSTPMRFGFIVAALSMVAGPVTGASMNPARSLAPALLEGDFTSQWIYFLGPTVGALLGCGIYTFLFAFPQQNIEHPLELDEVNHTSSMIPEKL